MKERLTLIESIEEKQPLFREFCRLNKLQNGDYYKCSEFILWCDRLSLTQQLEIIRKYHPEFKLSNCNP